MTNQKSLQIHVGKFHQFTWKEGENPMVILDEDNHQLKILHHDKIIDAIIKKSDPNHKKFVINVEGYDFDVNIEEPIDQLIKNLGFLKANTHGIKELKAPMPGLVLEILVREGDEIEEGQNIVSLEAMKMENILKSTGKGKIAAIKVSKGDAVEKDQTLVVFE